MDNNDMQAINAGMLNPSNNAPTKVSVLEQELQILEEGTSFLIRVVSDLEERLKLLTLIKEETPINKEVDELRFNSPVVARIRNQSLKIASVVSVINKLQDNLEI